ncbi:DUF1761 domain-containing protein [Asticcacaulis sp. YBE204]|uniref:DUF1761 domain-containing protein n=1 Tax=Asticcacaulis sp. YBE204 TaxID=1282363 RepID=UPI0003C3EBCE|nr:DUF1761 domain-containing protein [Asticcacaulis sp. YBE204]ESQ78189.1 hypothetical protein AEYBE204_15240 [Asticcacaulis sp. YBE204]
MKINYWGVAAGALFAWFFGFIWYGLLFSEPWMALEGLTKEMGAGQEWRMGLGVLQVIFLAFGIYWLRRVTGTAGYVAGLKVGAWAALFFAVSTVWLRFIYGLKPLALIGIDCSYLLIQIAVTSAIICGFYGFKRKSV